MSGMDQMLAGFFGTGASAQPTAEDAEKTAAAEMFAKIAAKEGIDLAALSPMQIDWLWQRTMGKEASQEKLAEARKEHEEKKAAAESFNQATYFGKTAAHAYVAEMKEIIGAGGLDFMKEAGKIDRAVGAVGKHLENTGKGVLKHVGRTGGAEQAMNPRTAKAIGAGVHAAGAGAAAAGVHAATKEKKSSASAFEMGAAELALAKIAAASFDQDEAVDRLNAVLTLGMGESEKVASLSSFEDALERRSLEYAAAAGYPVEWAQ